MWRSGGAGSECGGVEGQVVRVEGGGAGSECGGVRGR